MESFAHRDHIGPKDLKQAMEGRPHLLHAVLEGKLLKIVIAYDSSKINMLGLNGDAQFFSEMR